MSSRKTEKPAMPAAAAESLPVTPPEPAYTKTQFLAARKYTPAQRDIFAAVLEDGKTYTDAEADKALQAYMKRRVI